MRQARTSSSGSAIESAIGLHRPTARIGAEMMPMTASLVEAATHPHAAGARPGARLRVICAVAAAGLLAAAGFAVAHALGARPSAPPATCSETCAPSPATPPPALGPRVTPRQ